MVEAKKWHDFTVDRLELVLSGIKTKFEIVSEKLIQVDNESNAFQAELAQYQAGESQQKQELIEEIQKREVLEADYIKANSLLSNMMQRISKSSDIEEKNERLQLQNDELFVKLTDSQNECAFEK